LYIIDARPRANALANGAKGGGSESSSNYPRSEVMLAVIVIKFASVPLHYTFFFSLLPSTVKRRNYLFSLIHWIWDQVLFLGIQNIHTMRDSLSRLRDYVDAHGSISSNGTPSAVSVVGDRVS